MLELILSDHNRRCLMCTRDGKCELQKLAIDFGIDELDYPGDKTGKLDNLSPSIVRDDSKCVLCKRCISVCKNVQSVSAIAMASRGRDSRVATYYDESLNDVNCTFCGQCVRVCPVGALKEKDNTKIVLEKLQDKNLFVIAQTAPAVRVALGEEFGMPIGTNVAGKMVASLRKLGFYKVFDTNTGADATIIEEAHEFIDRLQYNKTLPMITSCSPGWVRFLEQNYPELKPHLSTCKSPHQMFGAILKSYYAKKQGLDPSKIFLVSVMPCTAKKYEITRPEMHQTDENGNILNDVDLVITTRELAKLIKQEGIDFVNLEDEVFDNPIGEASGAGAIFGTAGGVMEAALRTVAETLTWKKLDKIEFNQVRGEEGVRRATVNIADKEIKVVVANGLGNARKILEEIKSGKADYQFVEIMACPGGCIMGGGQPICNATTLSTVDVRKLRAEAIYSVDEKSVIRCSHENPYLKEMYNEYLDNPGSKKAHELLHTN